MNIQEAIQGLEEHGAAITKGDYYYTVCIYDHIADVQQVLDLTENEVIDLYTEYFN